MHTDEISSYSRQTQGVRVMRLDDGVSVMSIARTEREEETDEETEILKKLLLMIQPKLKLLTKAKQKEMSSNYEKIN